MSHSVITLHNNAYYRKGQKLMSLPWHKLNRKKQNYYIILATILIAGATVGVVFMINMAV